MGLAISFVSQVNEKVWYHSCPSRGKGCYNTKLKDEGGCCIWYNELGVIILSFYRINSNLRSTI